jgi:cyclic pyranopterin phosphate synthase
MLKSIRSPIPEARSLYLRLSVTPHCNLRCRYCRPASGGRVKGGKPGLNREEWIRLISAIHQVKPVRKIRFTGGEPLLKADLVELITAFRENFPLSKLCLTTNGILLKEKALSLRRAGVQALNISLDAAQGDRYRSLCRDSGFERVLEGIAAASRAGFEKVKLNTVLMRSANFDQLADLIRIAAQYDCEIRFVELMPYGEGAALFARDFLPADEALSEIKKVFPYLGPASRSETASRHLLEVDGREQAIGFITSVSSGFCMRCDRLRVDSFGSIYPCLRTEEGTRLMPLLQSEDDDALKEQIRRTLDHKRAPAATWPERSMAQLGG